MVQGRCFKCKVTRDIKDARVAITREGKGRAFTGQCSVCGTKMFAMISKADADKAIAAGMKSYTHESAPKKGGDDEVEGGAQRKRRKSSGKKKRGGCDCDKK